MPLALLGLIVDSHSRELVVAPVAFITLISFIGHKEWRFIVYIVPILNVIAARGASWMYVGSYPLGPGISRADSPQLQATGPVTRPSPCCLGLGRRHLG